jgi:hypothetical protein
MAARFELDAREFERLAQAIKSFPNDAEAAINEVFHGEGSDLLQEAIYRLMPVSGKHWSGKKPAAKTAKSLTSVKSNLAVTVTTTKKYQYLYFPDDGTSTTRHVGNQQFFRRGGEEKQAEIIDRCIGRLVSGFEK